MPGPLFKKQDRTCICSKVMENIIFGNIMLHIETYGILSGMQFGFCKHYSAQLQLLFMI